MPSTKIEFNAVKIARIQGLDELAGLLLPRNKGHQKVFLAIFIEVKYSKDQFLPALAWSKAGLSLCEKYAFSPRMLETVRSKMRRMGLIDHVSRFNKSHGGREGWVFSTRFSRSADRLAELVSSYREPRDLLQEQKDRDLFRYI